MISSRSFDVLIVGAGPAGIAAAVTAAHHASRVGLVDMNRSVGGQIWRADSGGSTPAAALPWLEQLSVSGVEVLSTTQIIDSPSPGILYATKEDAAIRISYAQLILATGARERFLPFPGWTLPNIMGAGGLQALVKGGFPVRGKRVVVSGTGPLLLAVAANLRSAGAVIELIADQVTTWRWLMFGLGLLQQPGLIAQALDLKRALAGIPYHTNAWVTSASGTDRVEAVTISHNHRTRSVACDFLACGFHLVPNLELPALLGCALKEGAVAVDSRMQTSIDGVFAAGEASGVGGVELALVEGQLAALSATGQKDREKPIMQQRSRLRRYAARIEKTFALRSELQTLSDSNTRVCRCEDVDYGELVKYNSWRAAKLHSRCGMGACQGRVCGAATEFLFGWNVESKRPPLWPTAVSTLEELNIPGPEMKRSLQ